MDILTDLFNDRDLAAIFWILIFLILALSIKSIRSSINSIFGMLFQKKIMIALILMIIYVNLIIQMGFRFQLWDFTMLKDTVYWFFGSALILFYRFNEVIDDDNYFKKKLLNNLKFILVLEFIINYYIFNFWFELLQIPFITIINTMIVVIGNQKEYAQINKLLKFILAVYGIFLVVYAIIRIQSDFRNTVNAANLGTFLLPLILTLSFLPFIYSFSLYAAYERLFVNLSIYIGKDKNLLHFTERKIFQICLFRLSNIRKLKREYLRDLLIIREKEDVLNLVRKYKRGIS